MDHAEVREMTRENLRKMQLVELDLLVEMDRICRKYDIKYALCGGTLLGAVRHKGFIPWDDDVDVRMLRSEYNKFSEACKKELDQSKYFLQDFKSDPYYRWGYAKLTNINTVYRRTGQDNLKMRKHMFIDIFISDGMPNSERGRKIHQKVRFCIQKILWSPVGMKVSASPWLRAWYRLLSLIPRNVMVGMVHLLARMFPAEKAEIVCSLTFPATIPMVRMKNLVELEFEGHMFWASAYAHDWLVAAYGPNYMELPPENQRYGHNTASYYRFEDEAED